MKKVFLFVIIPVAMISWIIFLVSHIVDPMYDQYFIKDTYWGDRAFESVLEELTIDHQVIDDDNFLSDEAWCLYVHILSEKRMYHMWRKVLFGKLIISPWEMEHILKDDFPISFHLSNEDEDVNEIIKI
jgi:hypothetical protein